MNDVKISDRNTNTEYLRMALNICEMNINYIQADLILKVIDKLNQLKGDFTLNDGTDIYYKWKKEWISYFEKLNKNK